MGFALICKDPHFPPDSEEKPSAGAAVCPGEKKLSHQAFLPNHTPAPSSSVHVNHESCTRRHTLVVLSKRETRLCACVCHSFSHGCLEQTELTLTSLAREKGELGDLLKRVE